jgi:hypothetical protein
LREFAGRHLTLSTVWVVVVIAGLFVSIEQRQIRPNDFWWHLRLGELIVEMRSIPSLEPFGFTIAGEEWLDQPWLAQVLLHATLEVGGATAILLLHGLTITGGYALVLLAVRPRDYGRDGVTEARESTFPEERLREEIMSELGGIDGFTEQMEWYKGAIGGSSQAEAA